MNEAYLNSAQVSSASMLHRTDPLSKLLMLLCAVSLAMHWERPLPEGGLLALLLAVSFTAAKMPARETGKRLAFIVCFAVPLFILTLLAAPEGAQFAAAGPLKLTYGGLDNALVVALRLASLFLSSYIYISTTAPRDFVYMLTRWLKVPYRFAFGVSVALTFLPLLEAEGKIASAARKIRSGRPPRGMRERAGLWTGLAGSVFTASLRRVQQTAGAMEVKGFGAYRERTFLREIKLSAWGMGAGVLAALVTVWLWIIL